MKNLLITRILILVSAALIISSILVAFVGIFLSEGLIADIKAQQFIPDMAVTSQCVAQYQNGSITKEEFTKIMDEAAVQNSSTQYTIFDENKQLIYSSVQKGQNTKLISMLDEVIKRGKVFHISSIPLLKPSVLVGVAVKDGGRVIGAVFVSQTMSGIIQIRMRFLKSLSVAMLIVVPIILMLTYLFLKRLTKPLKNIGTVALSMVKGDFSVRADESMVDEVGILGKSLNKLSVELYKNISALFLEKDRLTQVLNSLEEGMLAVDKDKAITHSNPAFEEMFGCNHSICGNKIESVPPLANVQKELCQAIEENCTIVKNINYDSVIMRMIISPVKNDKDETAGAVLLFRDITEAERLESARRNYVSNVSHELRSPLTSIRGLIEPLKENMVKDETDKMRYYDIISRETMRLSRLIDDIMELSRLQTKDSAIEKRYFNLNDLLEILYERYRVFPDIKLVFNSDENIKVYSNPDRIEQVMVILLDNAYKFTPKGGEITVTAKKLDLFVKVTVKDTGCGISDEDLPYIFDRFYKSDKSRSKSGAGLGLSILKEILNSMGESVSVVSEPEKGSEFTFTIGVIPIQV